MKFNRKSILFMGNWYIMNVQELLFRRRRRVALHLLKIVIKNFMYAINCKRQIGIAV